MTPEVLTAHGWIPRPPSTANARAHSPIDAAEEIADLVENGDPDDPNLPPQDPATLGKGMEADRNLARSYAQNGDKYWAIGATHEKMPAGVYTPGVSQEIGIYLEKMENKTDGLLNFPDSASEMVLAEMREFQRLKDRFEKYGFLHKRGIMLYGPPGSGKTTTIQQLIAMIVKEGNGIALFLDHPVIAARALRMIRSIEPERQILGIMEDFDGLLQSYGESGYLSLLDGEAQVDNVVMVATTNHVGRIEARFRDRPSRFDLIQEIGMPSAAARRMYLSVKAPDIAPEVLEQMVKASEGYSVAHLREMIILTQVFEVPLAAVGTRLGKMAKIPKERNPRDDGKTMGFGGKKKSWEEDED